MAMSRPIAVVALMLAVASSFGCAGRTGADGRGALWRTASPTSAAPELQRVNTLLADLAERLRPGLVHVRVRRAAGSEAAGEEPGEPRRSTGSGFVIDPSGLIVTNAHVVEGAESIQVRLSDGRRFAGNLVGRDTRVDLALIKIQNATNLTVLPLGDSNRLRVGEFVLALGHPFGLEQSVSLGIVSRKGAPLTVAAPGFDFIQTDAAINPGNSGGPLVNMAGEVIGVNSMAARNGSIGFAIPSNLVQQLVAARHEGQGRVGLARCIHRRGHRGRSRTAQAARAAWRAGPRRHAGRARRAWRRACERRHRRVRRRRARGAARSAARGLHHTGREEGARDGVARRAGDRGRGDGRALSGAGDAAARATVAATRRAQARCAASRRAEG